MATVALIGLGNMGAPMAGNIAATGHKVVGFDLSKENLDGARGRGVEGVNSAREAVAQADAVATCLPKAQFANCMHGRAMAVARQARGEAFSSSSRWNHRR